MEFNIFQGDVIACLRRLPDESVDCVVTSPPYWGLRDYHVDGQIGIEQSPEEYVSKLVEVFREVRRVLKNTGTCWLNLGDSYAGSGRGRDADGTWNPGKGGSKQETNIGAITGRVVNPNSLNRKAIEEGAIGNAWVKPPQGLKCKDLVGIPWMVAFALQKDGWWLRQDIIWAKPNPMPESVMDRCTKSHEYIFLLSKSERYYFNNTAIKEDSKWKGDPRAGYGRLHYRGKRQGIKGTGQENFVKITEKRNKRTVWTITLQKFKGAHFATFPPELPELCIKAGCPEGGVVLDPFLGSGTTLMVARELGRSGIGIELNPEYVVLAKKRVGWNCGLDVQFKEEKCV